MEPTHGTPPAAGIASFRSATTKNNIPLKSKTVKWIFSGGISLCVTIDIILIVLKLIVSPQEPYLCTQPSFGLLPPCIQIIQIPISSRHIIIICILVNKSINDKVVYICKVIKLRQVVGVFGTAQSSVRQ